MKTRLAALIAAAALTLVQCAQAVAPVDPGDGSAAGDAIDASDARDTGIVPPRDAPLDAQPVACNQNIVDGDRCTTTHDACLINFACGASITCDCGNDGLWHCTRTQCTTDSGH